MAFTGFGKRDARNNDVSGGRLEVAQLGSRSSSRVGDREPNGTTSKDTNG